MHSADIPPNQSIYIKNLNEKIKKEELKRSLYALFSQYGRILDIVALKTPKLRGQAWVVFSEVTASSNAVRQMQNFPFYDKPMRIQYAKSKSDCVAKADGSYNQKEKKKQEEKGERRRYGEGAQHTATAGNGVATSTGGSFGLGQSAKESSSSSAVPNNILFIENLASESTSLMVKVLFEQYPGFREVRMIDAKPGIAFVEFDDDMHAFVAMEALQGFKVSPQHPMAISFAKK